jgi:hypothetical protein
MPEKETLARSRAALRKGKSPSSAAGEFVREEMHHIREGKHGAASAKQAIAIGLSKARRAGVPLKAPPRGKVDERTRQSLQHAYEVGQGLRKARASKRRSKASLQALKRKPRRAASKRALSRQAKGAASARRAG